MEMDKPQRSHNGAVAAAVERWVGKVAKIGKALKAEGTKVGRDDPRKVVHPLKVGIALTLASLVYLLEPFFHGMGQNAIWAVITVIVVLEFTAGATLYKGINRGLGTVLAISLAFLIEIFAQHVGDIGRAICIGFFVFLIGSLATYVRFIPSVKKHYDYGLIVFVLTFNLVMVGSYHDANAFHSAIQRIYTIAIGCGICLVTSLLILPNWLGEDLHSSIISKFEALAKLVQACVVEYFQELDTKDKIKSCHIASLNNGYEEVVKSSSLEESWATFASREPRHSRYFYPWKQYVHLGVVLRQLGYTAIALHGCIESHIKAPLSARPLCREPCEHVAEEVVNVLRELAETVEKHHHFSPHISDHLHEALEELDTSIKSQPQPFLTSNPIRKNETWKPMELIGFQGKWPEQLKDFKGKPINRTMSKAVITCLDFSEALPFAAFVSLLVEMVARLDLVIEEVEELGKVAHFEEFHEEDIEIVVINKNADQKETVKDSKDTQRLHFNGENKQVSKFRKTTKVPTTNPNVVKPSKCTSEVQVDGKNQGSENKNITVVIA